MGRVIELTSKYLQTSSKKISSPTFVKFVNCGRKQSKNRTVGKVDLKGTTMLAPAKIRERNGVKDGEIRWKRLLSITPNCQQHHNCQSMKFGMILCSRLDAY
jgi:hypothetical protein